LKSAPTNPGENQLGAGVVETDVIDAVVESGYPLQTIVGERLRADFELVQDEWGFIDRDTGEARALDILAGSWLWGPSQPRVRPELAVLVECKQSELPYIFFLGGAGPILGSPLVVGSRGTTISLTTDDDRSTYSLDLLRALGLDSHPFCMEPPHAINFSRAVRKGKGLALSGTDAYSSLLLPLVKALVFFEKSRTGEPRWYSDLYLTIGLGVIDAPMIGVTVSSGKADYQLIPWARAIRHESDEAATGLEGNRFFAVDVIHRAFLDRYLSEHLLPFAREFGDRVLAQQAVILSGEGFAKGLGAWTKGDALYETLTERPRADTVRRFWRPRRDVDGT
jgi:hypothetical protein